MALIVGGAACVADPPPVIGTATGGDGEVTVEWEQPPGDSASDLVAYVVTPYLGFVAQGSIRFDSPATRQLVTGLTNGLAYRFSVHGVDTTGRTTADSPLSNTVVPAPRPFFALRSSPSGLARVEPDGSGSELLLGGAFQDPDLARDRSWLVMRQWGGTGLPLVTVDADGTDLAVIATGSWQSARISPDGTRIAAVELREGFGPRLVLMDRDGSDRQVVALPNGQTNQVDWAPDGQRLAVTNTSFGQLAVYDLTTGIQQVIRPGTGTVYQPAWSPDGSSIAFRNGVDLLLVPANGGPDQSLTSTVAENVGEFTWDGSGSLLFRAGQTLYRVRLDGSAPEPLISGFTSPAS